MIRKLTLALLGASMLVSPAFAVDPAPVPASALVNEINIPHKQFTLKNGLRVIVHTDRKAPVVAVSIWYDIGSKHEPKGKTGFAHLFEHLMFNGSENSPGDFFQPLQNMGATDYNGTTWFDRTNYFQTVPTSALDRILYLESDRMGYLLGAVTQENLTNQIGVVQNEKRQGDTQPYGLVEYAQIKGMVPADHPYGHPTIGSMADLEASTMDTVREWFRQHYGPNNAVLVLAGDIDVPTAKKLVEKNFGRIKAGPKQKALKIEVPALAAPKSEVMQDRVATTRLYRNWTVPGIDGADSVPLDVGATVLGGLASSRLDNILVREEKLAVAVTAGYQGYAQLGGIEVTADVKPGVNPEAVSRRLDEIIADFIKNGPTADEVQRVQMRNVANRLAGLESVGGFGGKAVALAEGALYRNDSNFYKKQLAALAKVTPADVTASMGRWLTRPVYALKVVPGERAPYEEAKGVSMPKTATPIVTVPRTPAPELGAISDLDFPKVERTKLSNGVEIVYARRSTVPLTQVSLSFDAGNAADPRDRSGTQSLMLALLDEGAAGMNSTQIAEAQERLGASINTGASMDQTNVGLGSLSANLALSLKLFADIVLKPDFVPSEVERLRGQQLARIQNELNNPQGVAFRTLPPILFGDKHPYGISFTGTGDVATVSKVTRNEIVDFHRKWFRPEKATFYVVSDKPLADIKASLETSFGGWAATGPSGIKDMSARPVTAKPRIILINRPDSPQSLILGGQVLATKGTADIETAITANEALGAGFLSRINMDLRESKGWSYGVRGSIDRVEGDVPYIISAPVQADKTGESIAALMSDYKSFLGDKGITPQERERIIGGNIRELPGSFETSGDVLAAMQRNALYHRPDNYYATVASKYRAMTSQNLDDSIRALVKPDQFTWVVVGDAAKVKPQLEALGLPIEMQGEAAKSANSSESKSSKSRSKDMAAVDGDWDVTIKSPMGDQKGVLTVNSDGNTFSGQMAGGLGTMAIADGTVDGNTISWKMDMTVPMPMTLDATATVDGDAISGEVKAGAFGSMGLSGSRK
jgi:zinc protease